MILILSPPAGDQGGEAPDRKGGVTRRPAGDVQTVLGWTATESFERIVIPWPCPGCPGFNLFSLARKLRRSGGPPVVLAGELRPDTRFWAERNGCLVADGTRAALELEVEVNVL